MLVKHNQRWRDGVDLHFRGQLTGERAGHIIKRRFTGGIGDMLIAAAFHHVVGNVNNIAGGVTKTTQQALQRMVKQIGRVDVNLHHPRYHRG